MVETRPTGRTPHELGEVTPLRLDCEHRYQPGRVLVGYEAHPDYPGKRARTYRCGDCGVVTFMEP